MNTSANDAATVSRLSNGMHVCMEQLPHLRSISAGVWIKVGSANEDATESGVAHFLEHLFFKGTTSRSVRELMEAIEGRGGHINAFTSREYTCIYIRMLDEHVETGIEILGDVIKHSLFSDWEKERNVILEEIASIEDTPDEHIHDLLTESHWPGHALGRSISGRQEAVAKLTQDDVKRFFNAWYRPENMFFSIAGNFDADRVMNLVRDQFENLSGAFTRVEYTPPEFRGDIQFIDKEIGQAHLGFAFPGPTLSERKRFVCDVTTSIMGGGSTSRLFERIREEEGLAYNIYSYHSIHRQAGALGVYAAVAPQNFAKTIELSFAEHRKLRDEGVEQKELEMNRQQIMGNMLMALESTFTRMSRMAKSMMYYDRLVPIDELIEYVASVTAEDVQAFARETFQPEQCALVVLGPTAGFRLEHIPL